MDHLKIGLNYLKESYEKTRSRLGKDSLPSFEKLNEIFDLEELQDTETDFLCRKIRRIISERIMNVLRFLESIINIGNSPLFFMKLVGNLSSVDKEELGKLYEDLGLFGLESLRLDLDYSEKKEVEFINRAFNLFLTELNSKIYGILDKMSKKKDNSLNDRKSYFG